MAPARRTHRGNHGDRPRGVERSRYSAGAKADTEGERHQAGKLLCGIAPMKDSAISLLPVTIHVLVRLVGLPIEIHAQYEPQLRRSQALQEPLIEIPVRSQ
jgi:hypothetical protein